MINSRLKHIYLLILITAFSTEQAAANPSSCDSIIVKFKNQKQLALDPPTQQQMLRVQAASNSSPMRFQRTLANGAYLIKSASANTASTIASLNSDPDIEYAECDIRMFPQLLPNDAGNQWYLTEAAGGIRAEQAWDITTGNAGTVIAVIDTGIQTHPDITRILPGYDFINDIDTANDGDGRDADPADPGDFVTDAESMASGGPFEGCEETFSSWHGTFVSGIIVANANNSSGVAGLDHAAQLLPLRALGKCGGFLSDISDAIRWAAGLSISGVPDNTNPADIINLSLGSENSCSNTQQSAISAAVAAGATVVVAAGNEGGLAVDFSPANCDNVIAVAATTRQGGETCYTNIGSPVDLSAPGGNDPDLPPGCSVTISLSNGIYSTTNTGTTIPSLTTDEAYGSGTSFAAPMVAGAAALIKALAPSYTPVQVKNVLVGTTRNFQTGTTDSFQDCSQFRCGSGILDINAALNLVNAGGADVSPTPFTFTSQTGVIRNTEITSNNITVSGINAWAEVNISNGQYSVNSGALISSKSYVKNGDTINVRVDSSSSFSTSSSATLTIGPESATFTVTTEAAPPVTQQSSSSSGGGSAVWLVLGLVLISAQRRRQTRT